VAIETIWPRGLISWQILGYCIHLFSGKGVINS
jgi:hypothetical protein